MLFGCVQKFVHIDMSTCVVLCVMVSKLQFGTCSKAFQKRDARADIHTALHAGNPQSVEVLARSCYTLTGHILCPT